MPMIFGVEVPSACKIAPANRPWLDSTRPIAARSGQVIPPVKVHGDPRLCQRPDGRRGCTPLWPRPAVECPSPTRPSQQLVHRIDGPQVDDPTATHAAVIPPTPATTATDPELSGHRSSH